MEIMAAAVFWELYLVSILNYSSAHGFSCNNSNSCSDVSQKVALNPKGFANETGGRR
jgi:hypothetical protein